MEGFVAAGNERNAAEPKEVGKMVGKKKEKKPRCWSYLGFSCVSSSSKAKVDNSMSNTSAVHAESKSTNEGCMDQAVALVVSESEVMTFSPESILSIPKVGGDLRIASQLRRFTFNELKSATRDFKPESLLGEGGFGCVFKGWIEPNGTAPVTPGTGLTVAVKTLNHSGIQGHKEWVAEVKYLGDLLHPNLVKLIGYCIEDDHRMLVYEFMAQGSLENHLFRKGPLPLSWSIRMKIALGVAKGLAFLHEETERPVIYRDFKAANILLDDNYNAKLSDFGLAIDGPEGDETHITTPVMGTPGYADPDYVTTGHLTSKSDVYSFGVFLLEMLTGRRSMDKSLPKGDQNLVDWAWPILVDQSRLYQLMDPRLEGCFSIRGVIKTAQLAQHCLSREPKIRPLMSEVVQDLQPLVNLKDMDTTVFFRHIMHAERAAAIRYSLRAQSSFPRHREGRGKQPMRSLSNGMAMLGSPYRQLPPRPNGQQS